MRQPNLYSLAIELARQGLQAKFLDLEACMVARQYAGRASGSHQT